jgi:predicted phosphodiesterase
VARADAPDFHLDLGDTFMTEKHRSRENAARQYLAQRFYFGQLSRAAPLFLVLGNHDGESPRGYGSDADALAVWSCGMRKRYFPNPEPDGFFTGNTAKHPQAGLLQDYYAWEWGDALFLVLDPFWYTRQEGGRADNWARTLGAEQYQWLRRALENSRAKFKFVGIHHLVGGLDSQCRGGAEAAPLYEWGGGNPDGTDGFQQHRPGWPLPIHSLLVQHRVSIVFHGHDHLYAKQELDGVVYQEVPQPGNPSSGSPRNAEAYGYRQGVILGGSGYLRVSVSAGSVRVDYLETTTPRSSPAATRMAHQYTVLPR